MKTKAEIETALLPDGLQPDKWPKERAGMVNAYRCTKCNASTFVVLLDWGTTPFMISCEATESCDGLAESCFYRVQPEMISRVTHCWYRPADTGPAIADEVENIKRLYHRFSHTEIDLVIKETIKHVERGGLLLRPITADDVRNITS